MFSANEKQTIVWVKNKPQFSFIEDHDKNIRTLNSKPFFGWKANHISLLYRIMMGNITKQKSKPFLSKKQTTSLFVENNDENHQNIK